MGHQGAVAKEFAWLVKAMWSGSYKSVTPRDFKAMVDQYIPSMQGNAQQDAQEFLAFLMNELHEDLNRVSERVYIPEEAHPKGMGERERAVLSWENHLKRNNSVIVDNFQVSREGRSHWRRLQWELIPNNGRNRNNLQIMDAIEITSK